MMADGWKSGDLAMCVHVEKGRGASGYYAAGHSKMRKGGIYHVEEVVFVFGVCGLVIENHYSAKPHRGFLAAAFKRIPPHTPDAEDAETIRLLNGIPAKERTT
jgi:hypothetical protein